MMQNVYSKNSEERSLNCSKLSANLLFSCKCFFILDYFAVCVELDMCKEELQQYNSSKGFQKVTICNMNY